MKPATVEQKSRNDPAKRISNGNHKAEYVPKRIKLYSIFRYQMHSLDHTIYYFLLWFCLFFFFPNCQVIVQNSRRIRHRLRKKLFKNHDRWQNRLRKRKQRLHQAKKLEQILNRKKNFTGDETVSDVIDYHVQKRSKRSVSSPRHVEALVVADPSMVNFHQDGDVEMYLLTIMNMVSSLYKDPAIGNLIKVVVIRIVLLEEEETHPDFNVTHAAEGNLRNFCR